jgi:hypothetical protein
MQPLSTRAKRLEKREMTFMERAYLPAIFQGLSTPSSNGHWRLLSEGCTF